MIQIEVVAGSEGHALPHQIAGSLSHATLKLVDVSRARTCTGTISGRTQFIHKLCLTTPIEIEQSTIWMTSPKDSQLRTGRFNN